MTEGSRPAKRADQLDRERLWVKSAATVMIIFLLVGGGVLVLKSCLEVPKDITARVIEEAGSVLESVAAAFKKGNVTTSFVSYGTELEATQRLQIGTVKQMELFERSDERTFGYIPLPEVVVEARAPIEYTYYVDLKKEWRFELKEGVIEVFAPAIEFNTPAVDASAIEYEVKSGSFGTDRVLQELKRSIMVLAKIKGHKNTHLVRETGRRQVREFVEVWLRRGFADGKDHPVEVLFQGEEGWGPAGEAGDR